MTKNKTFWVTGPSCIGSVMSPSVVVVETREDSSDRVQYS